MQLKPNELPDMVEGSVRRASVNCASVMGTNTISSATATSDTLTVGTPSISGANISFLVTADQVGTHWILLTANLSSSEVEKGYIRVKVSGQPCTQSTDYE